MSWKRQRSNGYRSKRVNRHVNPGGITNVIGRAIRNIKALKFEEPRIVVVYFGFTQLIRDMIDSPAEKLASAESK